MAVCVGSHHSQRSTHRDFARRLARYAAVAVTPLTRAAPIQLWSDRHHDPLKVSNKERREQANTECIGGLRSSARALEMVPGWQEIGPQVAGCLEPLAREAAAEFAEVFKNLGTESAVGPSPLVIQKARAAIAELLSIKAPASDAPEQGI